MAVVSLAVREVRLMGIIPSLLLLLVIGAVVVALVRRGTGSGRTLASGRGDDLLAYLLLAVAVGVSGFSLASLGQAAFPTGGFVVAPERQVATALAGLVVAGPFAFILWRRQRARRDLHPRSPGWTLYLTVMEAVFLTASVVAAIGILDWLISNGSQPQVTDLIVFLGVVVFHEFASRATPPQSEGADLPRVAGSTIGLVTAATGVILLLDSLFEPLYGWLTASDISGDSWLAAVPVLVVGAVVWWYRWLRPWPTRSGHLRANWVSLVSTVGLVMAVGSTLAIVARTLVYLLTSTAGAAAHFRFLPTTVSLLIAGSAIWWHHRRRLGLERTDPVRFHEYLTAAIAMGAMVGAVTFIARAAFERRSIIAGAGAEAITAGVVLVFGLALWFRYWQRSQQQPREIEAASPPRRTYLLGLGVIMGLMGSAALITTLVGVFQLILGVGGISDEFPTTISLTVAAGLAAWHLLATYTADKKHLSSGDVVAPFDVIVVCSHPGILTTRFHDQARLRVVYRDDEVGVIDDEMAEAIVAAVDNRSSYVWVDESGFRVAPAR